MRNLLRLVILALTIGSAAVFDLGCGKSEEKGEALSLEKVPPPFLSKARETLPEVNFDHARKLSNGNIEIRGKDKRGKVREVEFTPSGTFTIE